LADPKDRSEDLDGLLDGWGAPPPRPGFADRALGRVDAVTPARPAARGWAPARALALGGVLGGLLVGSAALLRHGSTPAPAGSLGPTHLQIPGVAEVVGEPGSQVQWRRDADGGFEVEVVDGVAWVRRATGGPGLSVVAGAEQVRLDGACGRVAVTRSFFNVDVTADVVDCERLAAAIEQARAELPRDRSR
jgi:hypothetical protein